jgi:hypothetical protein
MRRTVPFLATAALLIAACGGAATVESQRLELPVTTTTTTTTAESEGMGYAPIDERESPAEVTLFTGERVPEFEVFDHGSFSNSTVIDNPWLPLVPGTRMVFEGVTVEDGETNHHRLVSTVTDLIKEIDSIPSVVVWETDYSDGDLVEAELAFYAQDDDGTVWRMGEYPEEWEDGAFIDAPAWLAGLDGAAAGVAMPTRPVVGGPSYSQGWGPAVEFTDRAFPLETVAEVCVEADCFKTVIVNNEFNNDEPGANQLKSYAYGVGNIEVGWSGDEASVEELELVERTMLPAEDMDHVHRAALHLEERAYILLPELWGATTPIVSEG